MTFLPRAQVLSFEEIEKVARAFLLLGGRRLKLTGGEPLVRAELPTLVGMLAKLPGLADLSLTTNGSLLWEQAAALKAAGLRRLNISLDTLLPLRFEWITGTTALAKIWGGFELACQLGFRIKLNTVALRGITESEVLELVDLATDRGIELRFIEFMPLCGSGWRPELWFPLATIREWIGRRWKLIKIVQRREPAARYRVGGRPGAVGFIESLTEPFCDRCSRIRLTADGRIRPCLFSPVEYDLRPVLHDPASLATSIQEAVAGKQAGHDRMNRHEWDATRLPRIGQIGG